MERPQGERSEVGGQGGAWAHRVEGRIPGEAWLILGSQHSEERVRISLQPAGAKQRAPRDPSQSRHTSHSQSLREEREGSSRKHVRRVAGGSAPAMQLLSLLQLRLRLRLEEGWACSREQEESEEVHEGRVRQRQVRVLPCPDPWRRRCLQSLQHLVGSPQVACRQVPGGKTRQNKDNGKHSLGSSVCTASMQRRKSTRTFQEPPGGSFCLPAPPWARMGARSEAHWKTARAATRSSSSGKHDAMTSRSAPAKAPRGCAQHKVLRCHGHVLRRRAMGRKPKV